MTPLLRPLYERWLLQATHAPLAPWRRRLLARALEDDEDLRCLAAELAQFSHEESAPAALKAPDLRPRLRALLRETPVERPLFPNAWIPAGAVAVLLVLALVAALQNPIRPEARQQARGLDADAVKALALPSPSPSPSPTPTAQGLSPTARP